MFCKHCGSHSFKKNGFKTLSNGNKVQIFKCNSCYRTFTEDVSTTEKSRFIPNRVLTGDRYVITSARNNVPVNDSFFMALENYCMINGARLLVIPTFYQKNLYTEDTLIWEVDEEYLLHENVSLNNKVNVLAKMNLLATADNPLGGLDSLAKGNSLIVGHSQVQMRSLPVQRDSSSVIMHTTGSVTYSEYNNTKAGEKASFNHSMAALVVEFDEDGDYFIRILNCDDNDGFYDIDGYYTEDNFVPLDYVDALIKGDEHVFVTSTEVSNATYFNDDSIVNILKPKVIVRHDVLDSFTISHHHRRDSFLQYSKFINNKNKIQDELSMTASFIINTTPKDSQTVVISSNHHDHLKRWLNECDPKIEPWNAKIYHQLTYLMLEEIESADDIHVPDPFVLWFNSTYKNTNVKFLDRNTSFKIHDIELDNHGDIGANGSRGSISQFSKFNEKVVIAHSHSPGINKGAYQVGTSTPKKLEYTNGPSSWMNTDCLIYKNGKRQLISIINGKWRAKRKK